MALHFVVNDYGLRHHRRESRFSALALGAGAYAALLLFALSTRYRQVSPG